MARELVNPAKLGKIGWLWTARQRVKLHYVDGNKSRANPIGAIGTLARGMLHSAVPDRDSLGCLKGYARAEKDHRK